MSRQKYYRLTNILKTDAQYLMLLGERSNGKSYAVKEFVLEDYFKNGHEFAYIRRWREEIKSASIEQYFEDMEENASGVRTISKLSKGKYETLSVYRGDIYLANYDENHKKVRGEKIGYSMCLTGETHYKSLSYSKVYNMIFEEFITDSGYLPMECKKFVSLISTIIRRRTGKVFMIGNTLTPVCPYFGEWGLINVPKQKIGTIDIYKHVTDQQNEDGETITVEIAVEYCANSGNNTKLIIGKSSKMITSGTWQVDEVLHLPEKLEHYDRLYKVLYIHNMFKFMLELLRKDQNYLVYVYPYTNHTMPENIRMIEDTPSLNVLSTMTLKGRELGKYDRMIVRLLSDEKVCYSDNLTGTNFKQVKKDKGGVW